MMLDGKNISTFYKALVEHPYTLQILADNIATIQNEYMGIIRCETDNILESRRFHCQKNREFFFL